MLWQWLALTAKLIIDIICIIYNIVDLLRWQHAVTFRDEELRALIGRALQQAGVETGLTRERFSEALTNTDLGAMSVTIDASMY